MSLDTATYRKRGPLFCLSRGEHLVARRVERRVAHGKVEASQLAMILNRIDRFGKRFSIEFSERDQAVAWFRFDYSDTGLQFIHGHCVFGGLDIIVIDVCNVSRCVEQSREACSPVATNCHRGRPAHPKRGYIQQQPVPLHRLGYTQCWDDGFTCQGRSHLCRGHSRRDSRCSCCPGGLGPKGYSSACNG